VKRAIGRLIDGALAHPALFELQQKVCNNYGAVLDEFRQYLDASGKKILDVGCSVGTCSGRVVDMRRNEFHGIDVEPQYIAIASKHYPDGDFRVMDARSLAFESDTFDVVLLSGVLHHMADDVVRESLREIRRVVRGDGVVLVGEPVFTPGRHLSNFLLTLDRGRHIRTTEGYAALFEGFDTIRLRYFKLSVHRLCSFVLRKTDG
jgi:2-polyprenyl-3-methyl-5-hydroxy-6-metoxy-1,4-benzoquinol methylase